MEEKMIQNLEKATGKSFQELVELARKSGHEKHGKMVAFLKGELGIGHGFANLIAHKTLQSDAGSAETDLVSEQYADRLALKPIYDHLVAFAQELGPGVELAPKKKSVSIRRKRQFALIQPTTKSRIDLGLKFNDRIIDGRLEGSGPFGAMCTHRVQLTSVDQVDQEVKRWIKEAYEEAV